MPFLYFAPIEDSDESGNWSSTEDSTVEDDQLAYDAESEASEGEKESGVRRKTLTRMAVTIMRGASKALTARAPKTPRG